MQITPLIHHEENRERRSRLVEEILRAGDRTKAHIVLIPSASKTFMSGKIPYVFRQNSDFFYLTGCLEPDVVLLLTINPGSSSFETALFMPQHDAHVSTMAIAIFKKYIFNLLITLILNSLLLINSI